MIKVKKETKILLALMVSAFLGSTRAVAQGNVCYWQQHVDYTMNVDMNVENYRYTGTQKLIYTNNSPDTLNRVFYHLYFNAFQPGSEMDLRLQNIDDPDGRMTNSDKTSRIAALGPDEIGYLHAKTLTQDGAQVRFKEVGTVLVVDLERPILPGAKTSFDMEFEGQVPVQIRRSGRNSADGVALSMSQWYPKIAEYDIEGWHADPYIAREFHGVWGDFDLKLTLDKDYVVGGTGYLQNPQEIGHGYEAPGSKVKKTKGKTLTWHFKAPMVHDFVWAADPDYLHDTVQVPNGPMLHFLYKNDPKVVENWKNLGPKTVEMMDFFNRNLGPYPYEQYSVIQGGDGGMEYAMATLVAGGEKFSGLVGTTAHELAHTWFQHVLATNESEHEWMDEGFTTFISTLCMNQIMDQKKDNPFERIYQSYLGLANSGKEQPQGTHADRYTANWIYGISAYNKGSIFLSQLGYVIGQDKLMETLKRYYSDFKFKHPVPNDIIRTAEKVSGMELNWYLTDWTQTTNTIDYGIKEVVAHGNATAVTLERIGLMPMPIDLLILYTDDTMETVYLPLRMAYGEKENPYPAIPRTVKEDWPWAYPTYRLELDRPLSDIKGIQIDPSHLMADVDPGNNTWTPTE